MVRDAADATGRGVGVLMDLQGPKIRLGSFSAGPVHLDVGQRFTITTDDIDGDATGCSTTYTGLPGTSLHGDRLLIDDGKRRAAGAEVRRVERRDPPWSRAARSATTRACRCPGWRSACRRCRRRTSTTCASPWASASTWSRCRSCAAPRTSSSSTRSWTRRASRLPVHRQDREAARRSSNLEAIVAGVRRRSWSPAATSASSCRSSRCRWCRSAPIAAGRRERQAGHRRHPDARLDDRRTRGRPAPRPPTSPTPCSTAPTRSCSPARPASARYPIARRAHDGAIITGPAEAARLGAAAAARPHDPTARAITGRVDDRRAPSAPRRSSRSPQTGDTVRRLLARHRRTCRCWPSRRTREVRSQLALSWGVETFLVAVVRAHRRHGPPGRRAALRDRPVQRRRADRHHRRRPPGHPGTTNGMRVHRMGSNVPSGI